MDGAGGNGGNASPGGSSNPQQQQQLQSTPADRSRAVRAELELKRREGAERRRYFQPLVRQQIVRVFGDIKPAWHARLMLMTPANYAALAEFSLLGLAIDHNELLPDDSAQVVAEHIAKGADRASLITVGIGGIAGYYAWRGRRSFRFPFYSPKSVSSVRQVQAAVHVARYTAYFVCVSLAIKAPLMGLNFTYTKSQIKKDPRLNWFQSGHDPEETQQVGMDGAGMDGYNNGGSYQNQLGGDSSVSQQKQQQQQSIVEAAQPGWDNYKQASLPPAQQQQSRGGWGDISDFDDASPIAYSQPQNDKAYNDKAYNDNGGGGSSWDRLRRQSQGAPQQQPLQQSSGQQSGPGGWGDSGDGVDRVAQEKAQNEFDRLVERDRHGEGQDRSWGSR